MISTQDMETAIRVNAELKTITNDSSWCDDYELENPEFISTLALLTSQRSSRILEKKILERLKCLQANIFENIGDGFNDENLNYEIKCSNITPSNRMINIVQIREWHDIDYYIIMVNYFENDGKFKETLFFELSASEMKEELNLIKSSSAHGTPKSNKHNQNVEKRFSITIDDNNEHYNRWLDSYCIGNVLEF